MAVPVKEVEPQNRAARLDFQAAHPELAIGAKDFRCHHNPTNGWICTRTEGHEGVHVAHNVTSKEPYAYWVRGD